MDKYPTFYQSDVDIRNEDIHEGWVWYRLKDGRRYRLTHSEDKYLRYNGEIYL